MKVEGATTVLAGMAEVSVKEIIALEKSVTDKDQTIGALQEQIKTLQSKIEEVKENQKVIVVKNKEAQSVPRYDRNGYLTYDSVPGKEEIIGYRNFETVIGDIRKDEAKRLGIEISDLETKTKDLEFKNRTLEKDLVLERKEKEDDVARAKDKIRKHMTSLIDGLNEEVEDLQKELKDLKKDKSEAFVEDERKKEIIDLKERIHELETAKDFSEDLGWFKRSIYNWLKVDKKALVEAKQKDIEKSRRTDEISNNYPKNKNHWRPDWMDSWNLNPFWC
jgi:TolA-binding protein